MTSRFSVDRNATEQYIMELAAHGAYGDTGVWRPAYSPVWRAAQEQVSTWFDEAGLEVHWDAVGNVWGRLPGSEGGKAIVTGSHIDTQLPGGRYDGALGIVAGLMAIRALKDQFGTPMQTLEVVSFCQEESSRFPQASHWGSRAVGGMIDRGELESVNSYDGEPIGQAMRSIGLDPDRLPEARRDDIDSFVELHIEQGPLLEERGLPVAIVTSITGSRAYQVELHGRSDHAGGRPMDMRRDPMAGAAEIITGVINTAHRVGRPAVTTVGRIQAEPNLPSIVPELVTFTVNARHPDPDAGQVLYARHEALIKEVADRRDLEVNWRILAERAAQPMDAELVQLFDDVARKSEIPAMRMASAGGHDSTEMAGIARAVMLFVQSKDGRSHTPEEFTAIDHAAAGIEVLAGGLHRLAY